jgi:hypothetical protein
MDQVRVSESVGNIVMKAAKKPADSVLRHHGKVVRTLIGAQHHQGTPVRGGSGGFVTQILIVDTIRT